MGRGPGDPALALKGSSVVLKPDHPVFQPEQHGPAKADQAQ